MEVAMSIPRRALLTAVTLAVLAPAAWAQTPPGRLRGTVTSFAGDTLDLAVASGETVRLSVGDKTGVAALVPTSLADIKPGSYIGTAAVPGKGGTLVALEVHVFPEAMRGTGDGHRAWDLQPDSTMTNGAVGDVVGTTDRTLTVTYKGGQQTVQVPDATPIVTFVPGTPDLLTPGAHVIAFFEKAADGSLHALRIVVGKNGLVPPM
jgi:hypothetical protein